MLMNRILLFVVSLFFVAGATAQPREADGARTLPEFTVNANEVEAQLRFLASDQLRGRRTGSEGNNVAAAYIASHLAAYGYQTAPGAVGYFQPVPFVATQPPASSTLSIHKTDYTFMQDYLIMGGDAANLSTTAVFAGHGWVDQEQGIDDYAGLDVRGKVVFVISGRPDVSDPMSVFNAMPVKQQLAKERGAAALIELYRLSFPWDFFKRYFGGETLRIATDQGSAGAGNNLVYGWMKDIAGTEPFQRMKDGKKVKVSLSSSGFVRREVASQNVIGVLPGSDPQLRDEYVLLTAHYDHVGVGRQGGGAYTAEDSIFNGARDNAMGTVALLTAARSLAQIPPKRSVIILAVTGEEIGLLGSGYYAQHPLISLEKTVFNLNTDGAGYNDTDYISIIGYGRTGTDTQVQAAADAFGLKVYPDPAPEQNLFDRSDNVSFAKVGIPCLTLSPGFTSFDEAIAKYYHQVTDEADSVDMDYLLRYCQSFAFLGRLIADNPQRPLWKSGDKYYEAGKRLYGGE